MAESRLSKTQLTQIRDRMESRGVNLPCPRCGNGQFGLEDQLHQLVIQPTIGDTQVGGTAIPAAVTTCINCGYLSLHALGALGLLNTPDFKPST